MSAVTAHFNPIAAIVLMMVGCYAAVARPNLVKKMIALGIFQVGIFLLYVSLGKVDNATAPVAFGPKGRITANYSNPIPTALILTGIVVSVSTLAVALAITVCIRNAYGTIEMDELEAADAATDAAPGSTVPTGASPTTLAPAGSTHA